MKCNACNISLEKVAEHFKEYPGFEQYENALVIVFGSGGYGMFRDEYAIGDDRVIICHDCAHNLCDKIPWINELIQPQKSHTHRESYLIAHPDHKDP